MTVQDNNASFLPTVGEDKTSYLQRMETRLKTCRNTHEKPMLYACKVVALGWNQVDMPNPFLAKASDAPENPETVQDNVKVGIIMMANRINTLATKLAFSDRIRNRDDLTPEQFGREDSQASFNHAVKRAAKNNVAIATKVALSVVNDLFRALEPVIETINPEDPMNAFAKDFHALCKDFRKTRRAFLESPTAAVKRGK